MKKSMNARKPNSTSLFTVIGYYESNHQRFAGVFDAPSAGVAEMKAYESNPDLVVCGVAEGFVEMVDEPEFTRIRTADEEN